MTGLSSSVRLGDETAARLPESSGCSSAQVTPSKTLHEIPTRSADPNHAGSIAGRISEASKV